LFINILDFFTYCGFEFSCNINIVSIVAELNQDKLLNETGDAEEAEDPFEKWFCIAFIYGIP